MDDEQGRTTSPEGGRVDEPQASDGVARVKPSVSEVGRRVPNGKCLFGRMHAWLTRGVEVGGEKVYLCTTCGLVGGTGQKIDLNTGGGLFTAERVVAEHFDEQVEP